MDFVELIKEGGPILQGIVTGIGGYALASLRSRSAYRDTQLQFIKNGQKEIMDLYEKQIENLDSLFNDDRQRLKMEIAELREKVAKLEAALDDLAGAIAQERKDHETRMVTLREENSDDKQARLDLTQSVAELRIRLEHSQQEVARYKQVVEEQRSLIATMKSDMGACSAYKPIGNTE